MVAVSVYGVVVTREGDNWLADVPGLQGAHTYARNLEALDQYVREVVVLAADLPDEAMSSLDLEWDYRTGDGAQDARLAQLRADRRELEATRQAIEQATADAVRQLAAEYSIRDLAALTGLSRARVQQIVESVKAARPARVPSRAAATRRAVAARAAPKAAEVKRAPAAAAHGAAAARSAAAKAPAAPKAGGAKTPRTAAAKAAAAKAASPKAAAGRAAKSVRGSAVTGSGASSRGR